MHGPTNQHYGLALPAIATVGTIISIFSYAYYCSNVLPIELLWPPLLVGMFSLLWGIEGKLGFATLGTVGVLIAFGYASYLRYPPGFSFSEESYHGWGWWFLGGEAVLCSSICAIGYALGQWWYRRHLSLAGHCDRCGYNLRGNQSGRCSECGMEIPVPHSPK